VLLTGEVGSGKTTLLHAALASLPEDTETAVLFNTSELRPLDVLRLVADEFRIRGSLRTKADCVMALNRFLLERLAGGRNTVLIVDEAQNLGEAALEEVRLLSNLETATSKLLQIVLVGQPELRQTLRSARLAPLRQRIAIEHHVEPLGRVDQIAAYLRHRIDVAGGSLAEVFAPGVEDPALAFSGGCPRLINILADRALLAAYARQVRPAPLELVRAKAAALEADRRGAGAPSNPE
jgi:general secretion pathway protein A